MVKGYPVVPLKTPRSPGMEYYVRLHGGTPTLLGPVSWQQAYAQARFMSQDARYGMAEVFAIIGTRQGDPDKIMLPHEEVIAMFRRDKVILGGHIATLRSHSKMPPDM